MGPNNALALSKLVLSSHDASGSNLCRPPEHPPLPSVSLNVPAQCQASLMNNPP